MCGIYGSTKRYEDVVIHKKLDRIKFRGPDASIFKTFSERVTLGHNRLAIIDIDERSNQPFSYLNVHIVFNGEIYNFQEIKKKLEPTFLFKTGSDTEVICAAYSAWGFDCLKHLNGMFAFVIFDEKENLLFGARDRLGKKPLYYTCKDNQFEFASQPSQIAIENNLTINEDAISKFLVWQHVPDPNTIYKEVRKLKAGHYFTYQLSGKVFKEQQYWEISDSENGTPTKINYEEAKVELKELLNDAVLKRMISDVPLGVFLSGGIDSTLITAVAQQNSNKPIRTFSIKFNEKGFDESTYAELVARHLSTNHTTIECNYDEGIDLVENYCTYYDEPFADASALPSMLLSKHTKKHVTVALSGDGGDESFIGYERYDWINKLDKLMMVPGGLRKSSGFILNLIQSKKAKTLATVFSKNNISDIYIGLMSSFNCDWLIDKSNLVPAENLEFLNSGKPLLERVSDYDLKAYLNNDINTKVDRASMAFSLETRAPLMDYRIVEFARRLPTTFKYIPGNKKRILKDIVYDMVPKSIMDRPKQGFGMPLNIWFKTSLKEMVLDTLTESNLKSIPNVNVPFVMQMIKNHMNGKDNNSVQIWGFLVLINWLKQNKAARL